METTWVPWSFERLSLYGGYRAGVISPAWYQLLFADRATAVTKWMTRAARLLRKENLDASSAQVIDAIRLAETLAIIRGLSLPGIEEMREAALVTFCDGEKTKLELIDKALIIGEALGKVPKEVPVVPLQRDLEKQIKAARLSRERITTEQVRKEFDLRKKTNLLASRLLHRLNILDIPWGKWLKLRQSDDDITHNRGSFKESWSLKWKAGFSLRILAAGMYGNTVEEAAVKRIEQVVQEVDSLAEISEWVERTFHAGLEDSIAALVKKLQHQASLSSDVSHLMAALLPLVQVLRYGDVRNTYRPAVEQVIEQLVPRICIGLPAATMHIKIELAEALFEEILAVHGALVLMGDIPLLRQWEKALHSIAGNKTSQAFLRGLATRLLFDRGFYDSGLTRPPWFIMAYP